MKARHPSAVVSIYSLVNNSKKTNFALKLWKRRVRKNNKVSNARHVINPSKSIVKRTGRKKRIDGINY
jgi:hypothetical protein